MKNGTIFMIVAIIFFLLGIIFTIIFYNIMFAKGYVSVEEALAIEQREDKCFMTCFEAGLYTDFCEDFCDDFEVNFTNFLSESDSVCMNMLCGDSNLGIRMWSNESLNRSSIDLLNLTARLDDCSFHYYCEVLE